MRLVDKFLSKTRESGILSALGRAAEFLWIRATYRARTLFYRYRAKAEVIAAPLLPADPEADPTVTFVIPVYDREEMLIEAVRSIWAEGYGPTEVILVLDGSPAGTLKVARQLAKEDDRLRLVELPSQSGNAVMGRNIGIAQARGQFVFFLDSDDLCLPGRIRESLRAFRLPQVDVVYGGYYLRYIDDAAKSHSVAPSDVSFEVVRNLNPLANSTVAVRHSAFARHGMLKREMAYREDHELWLRLCYVGCVFERVNAEIAEIRIHGQNNEANFRERDPHFIETMSRVYFQPGPRPKSLVFVLPGLGLSGGIYVVMRHANALAARGMDVSIMAPNARESMDWYPHPNHVRIVNHDRALLDQADVAFATGWQTALDVINSEASEKAYFVQSDETRFVDDASMKAVIGETYKMPFRYLTEARWILGWLRSKYGQRAAYVPNGVEHELFHRGGTALKQRGPRPRVLIEGPIVIPWKGVEDAYRAVAGLDCDIWLVSSAGKPPADWKIDRFFERVPMTEMGSIYRSCDIFVKMSRVEGFFGPPLEAMACDCAVAVAEVSGFDEFIVHGENALVAPMGDVSTMRRNVTRLIEDASLRRLLVQNGRETAKAWGWDASFTAMERFVARLP